MNYIAKVIELIYPTKCVECGKINKQFLCKRCRARINIENDLTIEKHKDKNYKQHFYIFKYDGLIREKIIKYKFDNEAFLYRFFSEMVLNTDKLKNFLQEYDYIIPVPISKKRMLERGYNQSELIAKELCKNISKVEMLKLITKKKNNKAQSTLNAKERKENVKNVYEINVKEVNKINGELDKNFLVFDDIYTTGNTVNEVAKVLKNIGIKNIDVFTIAKD